MPMVRPTNFHTQIVPLRGALGQSPWPEHVVITPSPTAIEIEGDAPEDGFTYGRRNGEWVTVVPLEGATMEGPLLLHDDPVSPLQAATKRYTDELWKRIDSGTF